MTIEQRKKWLLNAQAALICLENEEDEFKQGFYEMKYKEALEVLARDSEVKVLGDLRIVKNASIMDVANSLNIQIA